MTDGQIRKLAEKVALERYPESYQNEHLSERKYFVKGFLKGAQDIKDGCYIKHKLEYSYVYNRYIETGKELNAVVKKMLPSKKGLQSGTIEYLHQFVVRGYEKAEKYIK